MNALFDTWAWIEYFKGTDKGEIIKDFLVNDTIYTSAITLAEISKWVCINNGDLDFFLKQIKQNSIILQLDDNHFVESGKNYVHLRTKKKDIGMIDVIIHTSALLNNLTLITADPDFNGLENVQMI